ncbi:hypothetical protein ACYOEI_39140, partial [Singulisphaera rosea]
MGTRYGILWLAIGLLVPTPGGSFLLAGELPTATRPEDPPLPEDDLPPALPEEPASERGRSTTLPVSTRTKPGRPIRLADSMALSLRNVETV